MMPGGAQRVIAQLCDHFVAHGHDTTLVTLEPESAEIFFPVSDGVRLMPLGRISGPVRIGRVWRTAKWLRRIRRAIVSIRPDVVISFIDLTNILVLMATRGLDVPVIVSERNDPHHHETEEEIYLVLDGSGDMVAGGGMDGVEGRHPARAGDAYFFRLNCTVGFYSSSDSSVKARILAVRSRYPFGKIN